MNVMGLLFILILLTSHASPLTRSIDQRRLGQVKTYVMYLQNIYSYDRSLSMIDKDIFMASLLSTSEGRQQLGIFIKTNSELSQTSKKFEGRKAQDILPFELDEFDQLLDLGEKTFLKMKEIAETQSHLGQSICTGVAVAAPVIISVLATTGMSLGVMAGGGGGAALTGMEATVSNLLLAGSQGGNAGAVLGGLGAGMIVGAPVAIIAHGNEKEEATNELSQVSEEKKDQPKIVILVKSSDVKSLPKDKVIDLNNFSSKIEAKIVGANPSKEVPSKQEMKKKMDALIKSVRENTKKSGPKSALHKMLDNEKKLTPESEQTIPKPIKKVKGYTSEDPLRLGKEIELALNEANKTKQPIKNLDDLLLRVEGATSGQVTDETLIELQKRFQTITEAINNKPMSDKDHVTDKIQNVIDEAFRYAIESYILKNPQLNELLSGHGGNCVTRTLLIMSIFEKYQILPKDSEWTIGVEVFINHVEPVLYNKKTGGALHLVKGIYEAQPEEKVYSPGIILRGFATKQEKKLGKLNLPPEESYILNEGKEKSFLERLKTKLSHTNISDKDREKWLIDFPNATTTTDANPPEMAISKAPDFKSNLRPSEKIPDTEVETKHKKSASQKAHISSTKNYDDLDVILASSTAVVATKILDWYKYQPFYQTWINNKSQINFKYPEDAERFRNASEDKRQNILHEIIEERFEENAQALKKEMEHKQDYMKYPDMPMFEDNMKEVINIDSNMLLPQIYSGSKRWGLGSKVKAQAVVDQYEQKLKEEENKLIKRVQERPSDFYDLLKLAGGNPDKLNALTLNTAIQATDSSYRKMMSEMMREGIRRQDIQVQISRSEPLTGLKTSDISDLVNKRIVLYSQGEDFSAQKIGKQTLEKQEHQHASKNGKSSTKSTLPVVVLENTSDQLPPVVLTDSEQVNLLLSICFDEFYPRVDCGQYRQHTIESSVQFCTTARCRSNMIKYWLSKKDYSRASQTGLENLLKKISPQEWIEIEKTHPVANLLRNTSIQNDLKKLLP